MQTRVRAFLGGCFGAFLLSVATYYWHPIAGIAVAGLLIIILSIIYCAMFEEEDRSIRQILTEEDKS